METLLGSKDDGKNMELKEMGHSKGYQTLGDDSEDGQDIEKEIHALLKILKMPLPLISPSGNEPTSNYLEGYLFMQTKKSGLKWKKRWCVWRKSEQYGQYCLYYYKTQQSSEGPLEGSLVSKVKGVMGQKSDDPRAVGMLKVTFASFEEFTGREQEEIIVQMENQKEFPTSKKFIRVFSPKRVVELAADTEDTLEPWTGAFRQYLSVALGEAIYQQQTETASTYGALLRQQYSDFIAQAEHLIKTLESSGFFEDTSTRKRDKSATLEMESETSETGWKKYRFILKGKYLYYYTPHKRSEGKRVIVLKFATIEYEPEPNPDGSCIFQITTPLITYVLKAKHKVAMEEWVAALERNKAKEKVTTSEKISEGITSLTGLGEKLFGKNKDEESLLLHDAINVSEGEGINPKIHSPYLAYTIGENKKEKIYKVKKASIRVGRSSCNDLVIDDSRISREHCRIDTINDKLVFIDLGSKRGSKLNHHMVRDRKVLQPGDKIKIGRTVIKVWVGKPEQYF